MIGSVAQALRHRDALGYWAFAVAIAYVPMIPSNAVAGRWWLLGVGAAAFLLARTPKIEPGVGHALGAALILWMVAGLAWSVSRWDTAGEAVHWVVLAAVFCVAAEEDSSTSFWRGLALGATVSAGFSVAQSFGVSSVWSVFSNPVGLFLAKNMAADVYVLALIGALIVRSPWLAIGPAIGLWLVDSRTAVVALGAAVATFAWSFAQPHLERTSNRNRALLIAAGVAMVLIAASIPFVVFKWESSGRFEIWSATIRNLSWFGDGLGSFAVAAPTYEYAHNEFLHYAFELGIGSAFLWGIAIYAFGSRQDVGARAVLAAVLAQAFFWFPLHAPASGMVAAVVAGRLCGLRDRARWAEWSRRASELHGVFHGFAVGTGAVSEADHRRLFQDGRGGPDLHAADGGCEHFPDGPQDQVGARAVRAPLRSRRAEA